MNDPLIVVKNVSKYYPMQTKKHVRARSRYVALKNLFSRGPKPKLFQALKDVSFDVFSGDALGIIGKNGSGKSTLLRIIAKISQPTSGEVFMNGSYGELFSLNSGFNMQLTGRQNIYLYAAIKGISNKIIEERIDSIIEFSELGDFIDQPVKTYSSGMRGRLGFSLVIKNLPDIMLIDEALATGDVHFQEKCQHAFSNWLNDGSRTLVFVSHSTTSILQNCNRLIWLSDGQIKMQGEVEEILDAYTTSQTLKNSEM